MIAVLARTDCAAECKGHAFAAADFDGRACGAPAGTAAAVVRVADAARSAAGACRGQADERAANAEAVDAAVEQVWF
jgi:hypothetical protein